MSKVRRPETEAEYIEWARDKLGADFTPSKELRYKLFVTYLYSTVQSHPFFTGVDAFLIRCQEKYLTEKGADLFMLAPSETSQPSLKLEQKTFSSAVNKTYRHNIVWNRRFPAQPHDDWITPENWFAKLNDIVRGTIVCKYIDGPRFLADQLVSYANQLGLEAEAISQQRDVGYYAYHFYIMIPIAMPDQDDNERTINLSVEIQLTTQLQEVLYQITHRYYARTRDQREEDPSAWKWEVGTNRFRAGYLGHTLHLLEGIILELRDSDPPDNPNSIEEEENNDDAA